MILTQNNKAAAFAHKYVDGSSCYYDYYDYYRRYYADASHLIDRHYPTALFPKSCK